MNLTRLPGSYRDPSGQVYIGDEKVFRSVYSLRAENFKKILSDNIINESVNADYLVPTQVVDNEELRRKLKCSYVLQHEKIPFISYPYEWSFSELKEAALHHLKFHKYLLERGYSLSDASAYNIQFIGNKPIFIDVLSIVPYQDGDLWMGYKQFCEQFLNPLLLTSLKGINFNSWYRGAVEGITTKDLLSVLSLKQRLNWRIFTFLTLYQKAGNQVVKNPKNAQRKATQGQKAIPKKSYIAMLTQLMAWIERLEPHVEKTVWSEYADNNTYAKVERDEKEKYIREFVSRNKIKTVVDLGCNTGVYSIAAANAGAEYIIGFDFDHNALEKAYNRARDEGVDFLPLWLDASNPSPSQGWLESERESFSRRFHAEGVIALAFEHHLAIAKNIPLEQVVSWITSIADQGVIEFIPKNDQTITEMLSTREDIFPGYCESSFESALTKCVTIVNKKVISNSGRVLYEFNKPK
jgi:ribosomal protein L11 methylase PrmA